VLLWCCAIIAFAFSNSFTLSVCMMFLAGFLMLAYSSMAQTIVQIHAPPALRGRVIGLFNMAVNGLRTFSGISVGLLGSLIGVHWSLGLSAIALLVTALGLQALIRISPRPHSS
jgi:MFS family permease